MKNLKSFIMSAFILIFSINGFAQKIIPFTSDYWEIENAENETEEIELTSLYGKECLHLPAKYTAFLKNDTFENFRLEMDVAGVVMPGLGFRAIDKRNYEYIYLRIMSNNKGDALQYFPVFNGSFSWQLYNYPDFEKPASFPVKYLFASLKDSGKTINGQNNEYVKEIFQKNGTTLGDSLGVMETDSVNWLVVDYNNLRIYNIKGNTDSLKVYNQLEWIHIKLEVAGNKATLYIEDMNSPKMVINPLKHNNKSGFLLLRNYMVESYFTNVTIEKIEILDESLEIEVKDAPDEYLSEWVISDRFKRNDQNIQEQIDSVKTSTKQWRSIKSEPGGLVNMSRYFEETKGSVLLKTNINSPADKEVDLLFDYSEHLVISLNSEIIFSNSLQMGDNGGRVINGDQKINIKLNKGDNEVLFVLTADAYKENWGMIAKIPEINPVTINSDDY